MSNNYSPLSIKKYLYIISLLSIFSVVAGFSQEKGAVFQVNNKEVDFSSELMEEMFKNTKQADRSYINLDTKLVKELKEGELGNIFNYSLEEKLNGSEQSFNSLSEFKVSTEQGVSTLDMAVKGQVGEDIILKLPGASLGVFTLMQLHKVLQEEKLISYNIPEAFPVKILDEKQQDSGIFFHGIKKIQNLEKSSLIHDANFRNFVDIAVIASSGGDLHSDNLFYLQNKVMLFDLDVSILFKENLNEDHVAKNVLFYNALRYFSAEQISEYAVRFSEKILPKISDTVTKNADKFIYHKTSNNFIRNLNAVLDFCKNYNLNKESFLQKTKYAQEHQQFSLDGVIYEVARSERDENIRRAINNSEEGISVAISSLENNWAWQATNHKRVVAESIENNMLSFLQDELMNYGYIKNKMQKMRKVLETELIIKKQEKINYINRNQNIKSLDEGVEL